MYQDGKYIYCIIETNQDRNFGPIGIGGRGDEVLTIGYENLSVVVSNHPITKFVVSRENILAHEKVIEEVMKEFDSVLPVRYGTVAASTDEIRNLLDKRYREFITMLQNMDHMIELNVKASWTNMSSIFKEIDQESKDITGLKKKLNEVNKENKHEIKVEIGKLVEKAIEQKKEDYADEIVGELRYSAIEFKMNKTYGDAMFLNAAFLVTKGHEIEFDNIMDDLSEKFKDKIKFAYTGPLPVFNFANITIYPEEWEV